MKRNFGNSLIKKSWKSILACALIIWLAYGLRFSTYNMLIVRITEDLDIPRSAFSLSITFRYLTGFLMSLAFGYFIDRLGIFKCLVLGLIFTAAGEFMFSAGSSLPFFFAAGAVSGIGYALASNPLAVLIVNKRFSGNRGTIMGSTSTVSGIGQALFNPVVGVLAVKWGWRSVYLSSTAIVIIIGIIIVVFLKMDEKYSQEADYDKIENRPKDMEGFEISQILRLPQFWTLMLTGLFIGTAATGSYLIFPSHAQQDGFSLIFVTSVLGVSMAIGNIMGKLVFGTATDRIGAGKAALIIFGANLIGVIASIMMEPSLPVLAVVAAFGIGFGISAPYLVTSLWVTELFGTKNSAAVLGYMMAAVMVGGATAMPFSNLLFERSGSYTSSLIVHAILLTAIIIINLTVFQKRVEIKSQG